MKSNRQHIFDKITRDAARVDGWRSLSRAQLEALAVAIALADRGVAIDHVGIARIADAVEAARDADPLQVRRLRSALDG